ncbi:MAG: type II toxin-antitoxin system RelE/ParE family toxin [Oscillospiraceae bacterium]|nr:type II toxin-antitoxin system RelE/ParE family toxin [Oscillospiraceae bacterium]
MYRLNYNPKAKNDIDNILKYIAEDLFNPTAAMRLAAEIVNSVDKLNDFPYINPVYKTYNQLKHEYRKLVIKNYIIFYYIDEKNKQINIARMLYSGMNYDKLL